jgi:hypothetical protein
MKKPFRKSDEVILDPRAAKQRVEKKYFLMFLAWLKCSLQFVRFHKRSYDSEPSAHHRSTFNPATELCGTTPASHRWEVGVNDGLQVSRVDPSTAGGGLLTGKI